MVAGDHPHPNAGVVAQRDGVPRLLAWRIDDADEGEQLQVLDQAEERLARDRTNRARSPCGPRRARACPRWRGGRSLRGLAAASCPSELSCRPRRGTCVDLSSSTSGAPLTKQRVTVRPSVFDLVERGHQLVLGVERHLADTWVAADASPRRRGRPWPRAPRARPRSDHRCTLRRGSRRRWRAPSAAGTARAGCRCCRRHAGCCPRSSSPRRRRRSGARRARAGAPSSGSASACRSCRSRSPRSNRASPPTCRRLTIAPLSARSRVPIDSSIVTTAGRPVGIAEMARLMPMMKRVSKSSTANEAEDDDEHQRGCGHDRDDDRQLIELLGERRLLLLDTAEHAGDVTDLARHARRRHDDLAASSGDLRVHVRHVDAVAQGDVDAGRPGRRLWKLACSRRSARPPRSPGSRRPARGRRPAPCRPLRNRRCRPAPAPPPAPRRSWPSRLTLAVMISICFSDATLSAALPS